MNNGLKLGILNSLDGWESYYVNACVELEVPYVVIDFTSNLWLEQIVESGVDGLLVRPSGQNEQLKQLYCERLYFVENYLHIPIYPSYLGVLIYENKRMQHYWMSAHDIKHPHTWVFYDKLSASEFFRNHKDYPLVSKPNLGGAAEGVLVLPNQRSALSISRRVFTRFKFYNPGVVRWRKYGHKFSYPVMEDPQRNYLYIQEFVKAKWEWRLIKIGNSYFGHQKLSDGKHFSGSGLVGWTSPPLELLKQTQLISELSGVRAVNVDYFETINGDFLVNEIQTIWGGQLDYQMMINGKPCRYIEHEDDFVLEEGIFHQNKGCNLRVQDFLLTLGV